MSDMTAMTRESRAAVLERAAVRLQARAVALEQRLDAGEAVWGSYGETVRALAAVLPQLDPGSAGELLTTQQMASRLNLSPKTLLRRKARGEVRPALAKGKLLRWRGDEVLR